MLYTLWQFDFEAAYTLAALNTYRAIVKLNNCLYNGQTNSVAVPGVGFISLIKLVPYFIDFIFWYILAIICYADCVTLFTRHYINFYFAGVRGELNRVVQQIDPYLLE